jgi:uncharacterized membrane protein YidH (DUF202 family)
MRKRHTFKNFFSNRWIYGIVFALLPSVFDRLLALKIPVMDSGILHVFKKFFAIRFTFTIPVWFLLSIGLVIVFILIKCLFFKKKSRGTRAAL